MKGRDSYPVGPVKYEEEFLHLCMYRKETFELLISPPGWDQAYLRLTSNMCKQLELRLIGVIYNKGFEI